MPRKNGAGKRSRKSSRANGGAKQQHISWTGKVARRIKTSIKKLVG